MPAPIKVGDVLRTENRWGRAPTSSRHVCPSCHRFTKPDAWICPRCGLSFDRISEGYVEVTEVFGSAT